MLFLLLAFLALITFTLGLPQAANITTGLQPTSVSPVSAIQTTGCISDNFITPWEINNLVIISPIEPTATNPTYISFSFCDHNEALELTTTCMSTVTDGEVKLSNGGYVGCDNATVRFQLQEDNVLLLSRWYLDPW